jgi:hypothetical protein
MAMGQSEAQVRQAIESLLNRYGVSLGGQDSGGISPEMQRRIMALVAELKAHPDKIKEILARVQGEDPQLLEALMRMIQQR